MMLLERNTALETPVKSTVIVNHDGFQPKKHTQLQKKKENDNAKKQSITNRNVQNKPAEKMTYNIGLPQLSKTLGQIKLPSFQELFRQPRQNSANHEIYNKSYLNAGRNIHERYKMSGPTRKIVDKHRISLSESDKNYDTLYLNAGRLIPEEYKMGGPQRNIIDKHKISLSEFDEIRALVSDEREEKRKKRTNNFHISPHRIHLQDFN